MKIEFTLLLSLLQVSWAQFNQTASPSYDGCNGGVLVTSSPFNADNTGNVDSAGAFNAAISEASGSGRVICVPPGTYKITEDINLNDDGLTLIAPSGANLRYDNSVQFFIRGSGNIMRNIHVDCNNAPYSGFVILGSSNSISGCSAMNCGTHGFDFDGQSSGCSANTISSCTASNNKMIGIAENRCPGNVISGNILTSNHDEGITADNQSNNVQIIGNQIIANAISGGIGGIGIDYSNNVIVSNNLVENTQNTQPGLKTQNNLGATSGLQVIDNSFVNNQGVAVWLFCNNGCSSASSITGNNYQGNDLNGNRCEGNVQDDTGGSSNAVDC